MFHLQSNRKKNNLRNLVSTCIAVSLCAPAVLNAQEDEEVEEVVVTGSYIRNSAFAQNSPVATVSQEELYESGAPSMANYIRDLAFTQNTNVVNNVLGNSSGTQSSVGTTFNLRGLGENSTLTLVDGVRSLNASVTALVPDIAIQRMEIVLDGGSALYGSDAVAGVVNIIPIKEFDGLRLRSYYQVPDEGGMEEGSLSILGGRSFDNGINWVGAFEARKRSRLGQYERPREWAMDDGSSSSGNPGTYREIVGGSVNIGGFHGGTPANVSMIDPSCGTFNEGLEDRTAKGNTPSGVPQGTTCRYNYTNTHSYSRAITEYNLYQNATWDATDWLQFELTGNWNYMIRDGTTSSVTTALNANNRTAVLVPASHPANPYGVDVSPWLWRPHTGLGAQPDFIFSFGKAKGAVDDSSNRLKIGTRFDMSGTWTGYAYYSRQERKWTSRRPALSLPRLQMALSGQGGPSGDQYFNPFGSQDPRSPYYEEGVTNNTEELLNWMWRGGNNLTTARDYLDIGEITVTGEVFNVPAGAVSMATGYQWRDVEEVDFAHPLSALGQNYNNDIASVLEKDTQFFSEVKAVFLEVEVPLLETLSIQGAVRHEQFTDFGLKSTTPKIALRWEASESLSLRGSWGESFLAPTPTQARPFVPNENCGEAFSGHDPFLDVTLVGAATCLSGNPNLSPETSTIRNIGFTWEPTNDFSVSLDYQEVEYVDRIRTLDDTDAVFAQFDSFLAATGRTRDSYNPLPGSADLAAGEAYLRSIASPSNPVQRGNDLRVSTIFTQSQNISSVFIDLLDAKARYTIPTNNWGTFRATLDASYFKNYQYFDLNGVVIDALGLQNAQTGVVPPLPKIKANLRMNWFKDQHSASISASYRHHVEFDDRVVDRYGDGWTADRLIDSETIVNAQYAYVVDNYLNSTFTLSGGIRNVFDRRPQRLPMQGGFESRLSVPWGRQFWLSLDWQPGA